MLIKRRDRRHFGIRGGGMGRHARRTGLLSSRKRRHQPHGLHHRLRGERRQQQERRRLAAGDSVLPADVDYGRVDRLMFELVGDVREILGLVRLAGLSREGFP